MRACQRADLRGKAALEHQRGEQQALGHCRAGTVQSQIGDLAVLHGKGAADALVEQIPGEDHVEGGARYLRLGTAELEALLEHMALGLLPARFAEGRVLGDIVEALAQRALSLLAADDAGEAQHRRG